MLSAQGQTNGTSGVLSRCMTDPTAFPQRMTFAMTPEVETGTYANFVNIWHMPDCFIFDFSVLTQPPSLQENEDGQQYINLPARVVSRVRVPPEQVFEIMKALNTQLAAWENETGKRQPKPES
jgi:hypothetical protein